MPLGSSHFQKKRPPPSLPPKLTFPNAPNPSYRLPESPRPDPWAEVQLCSRRLESRDPKNGNFEWVVGVYLVQGCLGFGFRASLGFRGEACTSLSPKLAGCAALPLEARPAMFCVATSSILLGNFHVSAQCRPTQREKASEPTLPISVG